MKLPFYQVDAFATEALRGNPAAVMPLDAWLPDTTMQRIAQENNLAETAFFVPTGADGQYHLRWFTPTSEIELCGHATLASAHVIFTDLRPALERVEFDSMSGPLAVTRQGDMLELDFPARTWTDVPVTPELTAALGAEPVGAFESWSLFALFDSAETVRNLEPDLHAICPLSADAVAVTAPGDLAGVDYVCRLFAPNVGIPEDPVTGSLQCTLGPYWAQRTGRNPLVGHQVSARHGELHVRVDGDRVRIAGHAVPVIAGTFTLPDALA